MTQSLIGQRREAITSRVMCLFAAGVAGALLAACGGSARQNAGPLASDDVPGGFISCLETPNPAARIGSWHTPVGFALDRFFNRSGRPLTVESVRLADAHGLVVHRALAYLMVHDEHQLPDERPWSQIGQGVPKSDWAHGHQAVPGAVIEPLHGKPVPGPAGGNMYQIVVELSATSPAGGWATGEIIRYRAAGHTYSVRSYTGYALAPPIGKSYCDSQTKAILRVFKAAGLLSG